MPAIKNELNETQADIFEGKSNYAGADAAYAKIMRMPQEQELSDYDEELSLNELRKQQAQSLRKQVDYLMRHGRIADATKATEQFARRCELLKDSWKKQDALRLELPAAAAYERLHDPRAESVLRKLVEIDTQQGEAGVTSQLRLANYFARNGQVLRLKVPTSKQYRVRNQKKGTMLSQISCTQVACTAIF